MEKIKIIDLLNKIANGEKPIIRYEGYIFKLDDSTGYKTYGLDYDTKWLSNMIDIESQDGLNTEVEIIEEDKKIEMIKVNEIKPSQEYCYTDYVHYTREEITERIRERLYDHECHIESIERTINKIIEKINGDS